MVQGQAEIEDPLLIPGRMTSKKIAKSPSQSVLLVSDFLFKPSTAGNRKRVASLVRAIRSWGYAVHVLALDLGFSQEEIRATGALVDGLELMQWKPELDPYGLPSATTYGGRLRKKLLRGLRKIAGYWPPALDPDLEDRCPAQFRAAVKERVEQLKPIAVIVHYLWLSRCLVDLPANVQRIIDTIDLMHQRLLQYRGSGLHSFFQCTLEDELKCLKRADSLLVIQKQEQDILSRYLPKESLLLTPHGHELTPPEKRGRGKQLLFLGSPHAANVEGLKWFITKVWPIVRQADAGITLQIAGGAGPVLRENPEQLVGLDSVDILGFVEDATSVLCRADVMVNPILRGSGLKIKVIEALCCGLPVVSTEEGVKGIDWYEECEAIAVANEPETFCKLILEFLNSESDLNAAALGFCSRQFSIEAAYDPLRNLLESIDK